MCVNVWGARQSISLPLRWLHRKEGTGKAAFVVPSEVALCCWLLIACLNSCLYRTVPPWMPNHHQTPHTHTHMHACACTQTNICYATVKTDPLHCTTGRGGGVCQHVWLFTWMWFVLQKNTGTAGGDGGFGHVKCMTSKMRAKLYQSYGCTYIKHLHILHPLQCMKLAWTDFYFSVFLCFCSCHDYMRCVLQTVYA